MTVWSLFVYDHLVEREHRLKSTAQAYAMAAAGLFGRAGILWEAHDRRLTT